jgi:hypothetical protein
MTSCDRSSRLATPGRMRRDKLPSGGFVGGGSWCRSFQWRRNCCICAHKENGDCQYVGLDWKIGALRERWIIPDDSRVWNAFGGITMILEDRDLLIGGALGIERAIG